MSVPARAVRPALELPAAPYPGLRPFQKHEWPIFFGRERMVDAVLDLLAEHRLIVVHGSSGCGKSSLITRRRAAATGAGARAPGPRLAHCHDASRRRAAVELG